MEKPNQNYINELSGDDYAFKQKLIHIIKKEYPVEKEIYHNNMDLEKYNLAAKNVHKLKHKISILGLEKGYKIAMLFENNLLDGNVELKDEFDAILNTITNYLKQL
jgi:HPt (histidine-containing phosphotransfer) domain-containing protein